MPNQAYPTTSSLNQGGQFAKLTSSFHGGARKTKRSKNKRMYKRMQGGSHFTPYADYPNSMDSALPQDLRELARLTPLDASFTELPAVSAMKGGSRRKSRKGKKGGAYATVDAPSMILSTPAEETAARLNPQWYTENTVIPDFRGPLPVPGSTVPAPTPPPLAPAKGGARKMKKSKKSSKRH